MTLAERIYNVVLHAALPLGVLATYWSYRGREPDRHTARSFQAIPADRVPSNSRLWIHGASVGEARMINRLGGWFERWGLDTRDWVVSTRTLSGLSTVQHPHKFVLPLDYPALLRPLVDRIRPRHLFVVETELWPNLYRLNSSRVTIVNARLSEDAFRWYRRFRGLFRACLGHCRTILARTPHDAERFRTLCPPHVEVRSLDSMKWIELLDERGTPPEGGPSFRGSRPVLVAGSTHPGEEALVLEWVRRRSLNAYLAPRHLERLDDVASLLDRSGVSWVRWSQCDGSTDCDVVLVDRMGLLSSLYRRGDVAFVGGSWNESVGGHNLIEPARHGKHILVGPHLESVRETARILERFGLVHVFDTPDEAQQLLGDLLSGDAASGASIREDLVERAEAVRKRYHDALRTILHAEDPRAFETG